MYKRLALAAALIVLAALTTGCAVEGTVTAEPTPALGVEIVVPYATTTVSPDATPEPDALYISADGEVILNDDTLLADNIGESGATSGRSRSQYSQLRLGDAGEAVSAMQERLSQLGYYDGGISSVFDQETQDAVKRFERAYGTMQTGIATAAMQERLYADTAVVYNSDAYMEAVESNYKLLEEGDTGPGVIALQARLMELGYPVKEVTGVFDDSTCEAVGLFYEMYGQRARDYAIVDLQKVLFSEDAIPYTYDITDDASGGGLALSKGMSGTRVTQLQLRLVELGYMEATTGIYDENTIAAVAAFQTACRLDATGVADVAIQQQLFAPDAPKIGERKQIYALLQWGDSSDAVSALQKRLKELGFYTGEADGVFSDDMVATIKSFQRSAGLEETGVATIELQELAFSEYAPLSPEKAAEAQEEAAAAQVVIPAAIKGDENEGVRELQQRLIDLGFLNGAADGKFGNATEKAVMAIQEAIGVEPTGEAGSALINIILSDAAPEYGEKYWKYPQEFRALRIGDTGDEVVELQVRLYELGYLAKEDVADSVGTYEEFTAAAVNAVMKKLGCRRRDGVAYKEFLTVLYSKAADSLEK
ncbi:MAG: peptidoglycan-binding protein [Clostridia bacterium]|nr:peptidoglycan-binding protein [Clostridia bacterium]